MYRSTEKFQIVSWIVTSYQCGHGLGSLFKGLLRYVVLIAKSTGKSIGREALKAGVGVANDMLEGQNTEVAFKKRASTAAKVFLTSQW